MCQSSHEEDRIQTRFPISSANFYNCSEMDKGEQYYVNFLFPWYILKLLSAFSVESNLASLFCDDRGQTP